MRSPADDEVTYKKYRGLRACDLVPNVLAGVESIDMSTTVMEQKLKMLLILLTDSRSQVRRAGPSRAGSGVLCQPGPEMEVSSHWTRRWREVDSNHRSLGKENCIAAPFRQTFLNSSSAVMMRRIIIPLMRFGRLMRRAGLFDRYTP
jgi:hypothetical protein